MSTTTDYDAPRRTAVDEPTEDTPVVELSSPSPGTGIDDDPNDVPDFFELPGADLSGEELTVTVVPRQMDEFVCAVCFLIQHRNRIAGLSASDAAICLDCA